MDTSDDHPLEQSSQYSSQEVWSPGKETPQKKPVEWSWELNVLIVHSKERWAARTQEISLNPPKNSHICPEGANIWTSVMERVLSINTQRRTVVSRPANHFFFSYFPPALSNPEEPETQEEEEEEHVEHVTVLSLPFLSPSEPSLA